MGLFGNRAAVEAAFAPYLEPGEQIRQVSTGTWKSPLARWQQFLMALVAPKSFRASIPRYIVALTDRRFVVLRFEEITRKILEDRAWPLTALPPVKAMSGMGYHQIILDDPAQPFKANFMLNQREAAVAISAALTAAATPS